MTFDGPVDTVLTTDIREHLLATLREALSNVTKHAHASGLAIEVGVDGPEVYLLVSDDGIGITIDAAGTGNGLPNIQGHALALGGRCTIESPEGGGTQVEWRVSVGATRD